MVVFISFLSICDTYIIIIINICDTLLIIIIVKSSINASNTKKMKKTGRKKKKVIDTS